MDKTRKSLWNLRFQQLADYQLAHGHCAVSRRYGPSLVLGYWVGRQRDAKRSNQLSAEREAKLNSIGFIWKVLRWRTHTRAAEFSTTDWDTRFEQLVEYKKANGNCDVRRQNHSQNIQLGRWVAKQRYLKKMTQLSEEHEARLNAIGFVWNGCNNEDWGMRFRQLLEYKEAVGDCNVPQEFSPNQQLGRWVIEQRVKNKNQKLTRERWEQLNCSGFDWGKQPSGWNARTQQLEKYKRTHHPDGLCDSNVPERCSGNSPLHLHKQATAPLLNNGQAEVLETESVAELKTTDNGNCWDAHFQEVLAYLQTHGDFNVPKCYPRNPLLARWVSEQRNTYDLKRRGEKNSLTPLREAKLDAIGFTWFVGGTEEETPPMEGVSSASARPEEARSGK
jgi:hypothetical protein